MSARQALSTDRHGHRHQSAVLAATRPTPSQGSRPRTRCRDVQPDAAHRSVSPFRALANRRCRDLGEPRRCLRRRCLAAHPGTLRARDGSRRLALSRRSAFTNGSTSHHGQRSGGRCGVTNTSCCSSRTGSYSFDAEALREPAKYAGDEFRRHGSRTDDGRARNDGDIIVSETRTLRSVWSGATGWNGTVSHPALMPKLMAERCVLSVTRPGVLILDCRRRGASDVGLGC